MTDALIFFHLLFAAMLFAGVVSISAVVAGARLELPAVKVSNALVGLGLIGTLLLGLALAIDIDGYDPWDVWVLIAIVLWLAAGGTGDQVRAPSEEAAGGAAAAITEQVARLHWIRVVLIVLLLADMIWKPWA